MSTAKHRSDTDRWAGRLARWSTRLHAARLTSLVETLLEAAQPLSPLGAHLLWVAQPVLGLVAPREDIAALARLLEDPAGLAWVREQLVGPDDGIHHHDKL